jgi:type 1 fimbriae regulatory protein FimB
MTNDRKHITVREVEKLMAATKGSRFEARDRCLLLMMFRQGLRLASRSDGHRKPRDARGAA